MADIADTIDSEFRIRQDMQTHPIAPIAQPTSESPSQPAPPSAPVSAPPSAPVSAPPSTPVSAPAKGLSAWLLHMHRKEQRHRTKDMMDHIRVTLKDS